MPNLPAKFSEILKTDQRIVDLRLEALEELGILKFFDSMLELLIDLMAAVEAYTATAAFPPPISAPKRKQASWNDRLRLHMFGSSLSQFVYAFSHLCKAQEPEVYGHMRRAIEAAGVAYLSRSKPAIGKIYRSGDGPKLWPHIKRGKYCLRIIL